MDDRDGCRKRESEDFVLPAGLDEEDKYDGPLLSFYKVVFGIKQPTKVDMPLNKETDQPSSI